MESQKGSLTLVGLKTLVGPETYARACREAWASAPGTGSGAQSVRNRRSEALQSVLAELWSHTELFLVDDAFARLLLDLYREMPSYSLISLYVANQPFKELAPTVQEDFWQFAREMLSSQSDALADPISYSLWCDFFEDMDLVRDAWRALVTPHTKHRMLERILIVSGPVPFELKLPLIEELLKQQRWHYFIYRSLLHGATDVYGKLDKDRARGILTQLKLKLPSSEQDDLKMLTDKLR